MKVLVAGASGAIGRPLIASLLAHGYETIGVAHSAESAKVIGDLGARAVQVNVLDQVSVQRLFRAECPQIVIDELTALPQNPAQLPAAAAKDKEVRTVGGGHLLEAAIANQAQRYLLQSCGFFYAPGEGLATESDRLATDASPGIASSAKTYAELEQRLFSAAIVGVALRYGFLYGPGTWYHSQGGAADQVRARERPIIGEGDAVWSWVHVDDVATATVAAIKAPPGTYNVVDNDPAPVHLWLPAFARSVKAPPPPHISTPEARSQAGDDAVYYGTQLRGASNAKAAKELRFAPRPLEWLQ